MTQRLGSAGLTLVELAISAALLVVLAATVVGTMRASQGGATTVREETAVSRGLRQAMAQVSRDVQQTAASQLTIVTLADGNHRVTLQHPVALSGGVVTWGVHDPVLGVDDATRTQPGWSIRFTVLAEAGDRHLVRQILDGTGAVKHEDVLLRGLEDGSGAQPGFHIVQSGVLWRVTISARGGTGTTHSDSYDLALMN